MLSHSKLTANRNNSQFSTGPRSLTGKTVVAPNACKHNLTSINITIAGEDLARLHRYDSQVRRAWHAALREFRVQQKAAAAAPIRQHTAADALADMLKQKDLPLTPEIDKTNPTTPGGVPATDV